MLQIISGKFFGPGKINEQELDAILYSNYSWNSPVKTDLFELRPVDTHRDHVASYVLRYTNRYQPRMPKDAMVFAEASAAVEQFRLIASLRLQAFFHIDASRVAALCRTKPTHRLDTTMQSKFVPKFFEASKAGTSFEINDLVGFIGKVLLMPGGRYRLFMSCLSVFFQSLEIISNEFDLAYSMMVYVLEALSTSAERPEMAWEDYDQNVRSKIDKVLGNTDTRIADGIRHVLLTNPHLKLKKRFVNFILSHATDAYFTTDAESLKFAIGKSELRRAASVLYDGRSGYVHELKQVREQLRQNWVGDGDTFQWRHERYLTFAGLTRLTRHILQTFVERQPILLEEDYLRWRSELPGITRVEMAPEYWVANSESFEPSQARQRFSGFVDYIVINGSNTSILDIRRLVEKIEVLCPTASLEDRIPMLAIYWMFNGLIPEQDRRPNSLEFLTKWTADIEECSIELFVVHEFLKLDIPWSVSDCSIAFETYEKTRHRETGTRLPRLAELALIARIANLNLQLNLEEAQATWIRRGILDAAGNKAIQDYLRRCLSQKGIIDTAQILGF